MVINAYARTATDRLVVPVARSLVRLGVTANWLTFAGMAGTLAGALVVAVVSPFWGGWVLALSTAVDAFDGAVARLRGSQSQFGSFYDSVADRVSDAALFGAAAWLVRDDPLLFVLAVVALAAAQITSYVRAKAESLGWNATVGLLERPERVLILIPSIALGFLPVGLWLLAVGGVVTIGQRFAAVLGQVDRT